MKKVLTKKYSTTYVKMLVTIIMVIDVTILMFAVTTYGYYKISSKKEIDSMNTEIVMLVQKNLGYMSELLDNYVMSEFYREDTARLMDSEVPLSSNEANIILNRITAAKQLQSMVDSVCIYNGNLDEYYSTQSAIRESAELRALMGDRSLKAFKPYLVFEDVLTYIVYKGKNASGRPDGAMIVNISLSWLRQMVQSSNIEYTNMYLTDQNGVIVLDVNGRLPKGEQLDREYVQGFQSAWENKKNVIYKADEKKMSVSYSYISYLDMLLVIERDSNTLYQGVNQVCRGTVLITVIFLFLGVGVSVFAGDRYYAPIGELIKNMRMLFEKEDDCDDDFEYLENVMMRLKGGTEMANSLTKTNMMREFLTNPIFFDQKTKEQYIDEEPFFDGVSTYLMLILELANAENGEKKYLTRRIFQRFGEGIQVEKTETEGLIVLKNTPTDQLLEFVEREFAEHDGIFVFACAQTNEPEQLARIYEKSKILSKYKSLFEERCCLSEEEICMEQRLGENHYPTREQERLLRICRTGSVEEMDECFADFLCEVKGFTYENYCMAIMRLIFALEQEHPFFADGELQKNILTISNIGELRKNFHEVFTIISVKNSSAKSMNKSMIDSMKEYIQLNISDFELCSKTIATEFSMSTAYVVRMFRESEQVSLVDYITNLRMKTAVELLTSTTNSITSIMEQVGYDNKSKFYRHFKACYGTTPKEYRLENFKAERLNRES